jgi:hypothetical protein
MQITDLAYVVIALAYMLMIYFSYKYIGIPIMSWYVRQCEKVFKLAHLMR